MTVDGHTVTVPEGVTLQQALEYIAFTFDVVPQEGRVAVPCGTGGCWRCAVLVDGCIVRACVFPTKEGIAVQTLAAPDQPPLRIIHGPHPSTAGGEATPMSLAHRGEYVEVVIWTAGCNLRCPQCQNYRVTYDGVTEPLTPDEAAQLVTQARGRYSVDRMTVSGGEPTLNRPWLGAFFRALRRRNPDSQARLYLDSNGSLLTRDYIDELVASGVTDIGVEPKAVTEGTYMRITGLSSQALAKHYLTTAWSAIRYISEQYPDQVFLGVGLLYNRALISLEEVEAFGQRLATVQSNIQVRVRDCFPAFRQRNLHRPSLKEMVQVKGILEGTGLEAVAVQTVIGTIGPNK
jgi:pyruvate formate lyase activating enzyme